PVLYGGWGQHGAVRGRAGPNRPLWKGSAPEPADLLLWRRPAAAIPPIPGTQRRRQYPLPPYGAGYSGNLPAKAQPVEGQAGYPQGVRVQANCVAKLPLSRL